MNVEFKPIDPAPSDAERTVYNVFVAGVFVGYVHKSWMGFWAYFVNGEAHYEYGYDDRCDLFAIIKDEYKTP